MFPCLHRLGVLAIIRSISVEAIAATSGAAARGHQHTDIGLTKSWGAGHKISYNGTAALQSALIEALESKRECDLCGGGQEWLFILGTGRSGSTTALEMVDAIPGVYLAGENLGVMNALLDMYEAHRDRIENQVVSENRVFCALQQFVRTIIGQFDEKSTRVIGFKEIRHVNQKQIDFFKKVFPGARFLLNTRKNLEKQHKSQFQMDIPMEELKNWTAQLEFFPKHNPRDTFMLRLEDFSVTLFNQMLRFLGVRSCFFTHVAHANQGWLWNDDEGKAKKALFGDCEIQPWDKFHVGCTSAGEGEPPPAQTEHE